MQAIGHGREISADRQQAQVDTRGGLAFFFVCLHEVEAT